MADYISSTSSNIGSRSLDAQYNNPKIEDAFTIFNDVDDDKTTLSKEELKKLFCAEGIPENVATKTAADLIAANGDKPLTLEDVKTFLDLNKNGSIDSYDLRMLSTASNHNISLKVDDPAQKELEAASKLFTQDGTLDQTALNNSLNALIDPNTGILTEAGKKEGAFDVIALALLGAGLSESEVSSIISQLHKGSDLERKTILTTLTSSAEKTTVKEEIVELQKLIPDNDGIKKHTKEGVQEVPPPLETESEKILKIGNDDLVLRNEVANFLKSGGDVKAKAIEFATALEQKMGESGGKLHELLQEIFNKKPDLNPDEIIALIMGGIDKDAQDHNDKATFTQMRDNLFRNAAKLDIDYMKFAPKTPPPNPELLNDKDIQTALHRGNDDWCEVNEFANAAIGEKGKLDRERLYVLCAEFGRAKGLSPEKAHIMVDQALSALEDKVFKDRDGHILSGEARDRAISVYFIQNIRDGDNTGIGQNIENSLNRIIKGEELGNWDYKLFINGSKLY